MEQAHPNHVGLNAQLLSLEENYRAAGINWYIHNLLCRLPDAAPELRYTAFTHEPRFSSRQGLQVRRPAWSTAGPMGRIAWEQLAAPLALRRDGIDLLHAMAFVAPVLSPCPTVITVLDLSFLLYPDTFKAFKRIYLRLMTRFSVRRAQRVIAISESTRQDVIAHFGVPADRVQTVPCGVDTHFGPLDREQVQAFRRQKGLPERFVLFLGTIQPRKNLTALVDAYDRLLHTGAPGTSDLHLVVAGAKGWFYEQVFAHVEALNLDDRVHFVGYVPEDEKSLWYNAALCFCYPSLYEGFGLPPLEAMACGIPVVTSNVSSLPEVVGNAGITVSPGDIDALSQALGQLVGDPEQARELSQRGQARAKQFSWENAARQTAQVYRRVLGGG